MERLTVRKKMNRAKNNKSSKKIKAGLHPVVKVAGERWEFHQYDDDPFPSIPHGHSHDGKRKLNVDTGEVIDKKGKHLGWAKKKDIEALKKDKKYQDFVQIIKAYHKVDYKKPAGKVSMINHKDKDEIIISAIIAIDYD